KSQFGLGGVLHQDLQSDTALTFFRLFRGLRFDYDVWNVNPNNRIVMGPQGFYIIDFNISKDKQSINVQSDAEHFQAPLQVTIQNFRLGNLTKMISTDTLLADGTVRLDARVNLSQEAPQIQGLLNIDNLEAYQQPIGQLAVAVETKDANTINARLDLYGQENNVELNGDYYLQTV